MRVWLASTWRRVLAGTVAGALLMPGLALNGQTPGASLAMTPEEAKAIEIGRKGAKPRPVTPRKPLDAIESNLVQIYKRSKPSVVFISASTLTRLPNLKTGEKDVVVPPGTGTGFVWDDRGHIVTNYHVVLVDVDGVPLQEAENLQVTLWNGKKYQARVIGKSIANDIAVLRVFAPLKDMVPLPLGCSGELQVGQSVLAIGNPFGFDHTLTQGIVSGLGRDVVTDPDLHRSIRGAIQTDASVNPGSSGGPLLDSAGRLIGMNTSIKSSNQAGASFGFAIPADMLNRVVPQLIAKTRLDRPELGFTAIATKMAEQLGVTTKGAVVGAVIPGGLADRAGLRGWTISEGAKMPTLGDIIIGFQGHSIENEVQLFDLIMLEPPDAVLVFDVLRDGKKVRVSIDPRS